MKITLRNSVESDLELFFLNQLDEEANYMAAFTPENPSERTTYMKKWSRLLKDKTVHMQTILVDEIALGCVIKFVLFGDAEITYALDKAYWGKGITSQAVEQFLTIENTRPIYGRTAYDNLGSQRILEKVGFIKIRTEKNYANARKKEIEEYVYQLS